MRTRGFHVGRARGIPTVVAIHRVDEILIGHRECIHIVTLDYLHLSPAAGRQYDEGTSGFHVDALGVCLGAVRIALRMAALGAAEVVVLASGRSDDQTRSQSMLLLQVNKRFDRLRAIGVEHDDVVTDDAADIMIGMRGPVIMERFEPIRGRFLVMDGPSVCSLWIYRYHG